MRDKRRGTGTRALLLSLLIAASLSSVAQPAPPAGVTLMAVDHDDDHMMMTWLGVALNDYANAMANWLVDASRANEGQLSQQALARFQNQLRRATFAYFEYSYEQHGVRHSRIYLATSGRPFSAYIEPRAAGLAQPAKTDADYFASDDVVRHAEAGASENSGVRPIPNPPRMPNRGNDAEIKALQSIMRDIDSGAVGRKGRLLGFVSKEPCASCSAAMRQFALETGAEVHVNYIHGANEEGLRTPAWTALRRAREAVISDLATMLTTPVASPPASPEAPGDETPSFSACRPPSGGGESQR